VRGIVESLDEPTGEVERLIANALETEFLCYEAEKRGALTDEGKIDATRAEEVVRCASDSEECAPRELPSELRSDERLVRIGPVARLVVLEGLVSLSDYAGVVRLRTYGRDWSPSEPPLEGFEALADVAGVTAAQARAAARVIERLGVARFGVRGRIVRDGLCRGAPADLFGCNELAAVLDPDVVARAQRRDR